MADAATTRVGPNQVSVAAKTLDTVVVVLAPLLIPAFILALIRSGHDRGIESGFTLVDIAWGGVAVAFAVLARSLSGNGEKWKILASVGGLVMVVETALAIKGDNHVSLDKFTTHVSACQNPCDVNQLREMAVTIQNSTPPPSHWVVALLTGVALCVVALLVIWKEA